MTYKKGVARHILYNAHTCTRDTVIDSIYLFPIPFRRYIQSVIQCSELRFSHSGSGMRIGFKEELIGLRIIKKLRYTSVQIDVMSKPSQRTESKQYGTSICS